MTSLGFLDEPPGFARLLCVLEPDRKDCKRWSPSADVVAPRPRRPPETGACTGHPERVGSQAARAAGPPPAAPRGSPALRAGAFMLTAQD